MVITQLIPEDDDTIIMTMEPETVGDCKEKDKIIMDLFKKIIFKDISIAGGIAAAKIKLPWNDIMQVINKLRNQHVLIPDQIEIQAMGLLGHKTTSRERAA